MFKTAPKETPRQFLLKWYKSLRNKRTSFDAHWEEIADMLQPRRARFFSDQAGVDGGKRNDKIINNEPLIAMRVAAAGMMAGITSPARRWFRFTTTDPDLALYGPVREYLFKTENVLLTIFAKSNWYTTLAGCAYPDLLAFGTHCSILEKDEREIIRLFPLPIGEYCLASNFRGDVDAMFREVPMTVRQVIRQFGEENLSDQLKADWDNGQYEKMVNVLHCIMPNEDYRPGQIGPKGKKFLSLWMEMAAEDREDIKFLRVGGYDNFPVLAPRWALTNSVSDVYGHAPGMEALGDCKELQHHEKGAMKLLDKLKDPPMVVPEDLKASAFSLVPGAVNYVGRIGGNSVVQPAMVVPPQALTAASERIDKVAFRVGRAFYTDLWLQLTNDDRTQPATAREINERHEEKMLQLGPVVNRAEKELLNPGIDLCFYAAEERNLLPEPPEELVNAPLGIEYLSVMSQAQRLVNVASSERFVAFAVAASEKFPEVLDVIDIDRVATEMATVLGAPPEYLRDEKEITAIRESRAQKQAQAEQLAADESRTNTLSNLGSVQPQNLGGMMKSMVGPVAAASAGLN